MMNKIVPNEAAINGTVKSLDIRDKATSIEIATNSGSVVMFAFPPVKGIVDQLKEGDSVHFSCSLQSNNAPTGFPGITMVINHVSYGDADKMKPVATFKIVGKPLSVNKLGANKATALIETKNGDITNLIRVYYSNDKPEVIDRWCSLKSYQYVTFFGYINGESKSFNVSSWVHTAKPDKPA